MGLLPPVLAASALSTPGQREKFDKHTRGDPTARVNSVYWNSDPAAYDESLKQTLVRGAVQIDDRGRCNVFRAVNRPTGTTFTPRATITVSGEKVARGDDPDRRHAFPYGNMRIPHELCQTCGKQIPW
jgi:hypothetical protein